MGKKTGNKQVRGFVAEGNGGCYFINEATTPTVDAMMWHTDLDKSGKSLQNACNEVNTMWKNIESAERSRQ